MTHLRTRGRRALVPVSRAAVVTTCVPCVGCGVSLRPKHTRVADWPDTRSNSGGSRCTSCWRRRRNGEPDAPARPSSPPPRWMRDAICAQTDPEAFFPEKGGSTREAKKVCTGCAVRGECLDDALAHDERFGVWGGLSERERWVLRRGAA